jgi:NADH:ubiquinone oxidoreductase subunit 4 (subunit M)
MFDMFSRSSAEAVTVLKVAPICSILQSFVAELNDIMENLGLEMKTTIRRPVGEWLPKISIKSFRSDSVHLNAVLQKLGQTLVAIFAGCTVQWC